MKTVLVTGCSSGFGLATATHFHDWGWRVIATMRTPRPELLPASDRLRVLDLDVTDLQSVAELVRAAGPIDVLVNNAGIGVMGALEGLPMETARLVFETNVLGTMALTQAFVPQFRERRSGVIVNIGSIIATKAFPLVSVYAASKAAIESFSASLALELREFDIRVSLIQPGRSAETRFGENARRLVTDGIPEAYAAFAQKVFAGMGSSSAFTHPSDVAAAVWKAVHEPNSPLRIPAGADAIALTD